MLRLLDNGVNTKSHPNIQIIAGGDDSLAGAVGAAVEMFQPWTVPRKMAEPYG